MAVLILAAVIGAVALVGAGGKLCTNHPKHDGKLIQVVAVVSVVLYLIF